jgi:hypothetical protein
MHLNLTTILAVYGSVLATIVFLWEIYKYIRDKSRLKINVDHHILVGVAKKEHKLGVKLVNIGGQSIFVESAGFKLKPPLDNGNMATIFDPSLPKEIKAGQNHTSHANPDDIPSDRILYGWVRDATGKIWKSKKWPLKR